MTEDEAKTKACCGAVATAWAHIAAAYTAQGHAELIPEAPKCVASACMAWRHGKGARFTLDGREVHSWELADAARIVTERSGFCGLAGAPQ
jgi:hypothetical protein